MVSIPTSRANMQCVMLLWIALTWIYASAHDDYLPLKQPKVIESPCVKRLNYMAAHPVDACERLKHQPQDEQAATAVRKRTNTFPLKVMQIGIDSEEEDEEEGETFPVDLRVGRNSQLNDTSLLRAYVNGQYLPEVHTKPGEFKRLRYVNAIANNVAELIAPDCEMYVLAMDGIYWEAPVKRDVVVIPPGGRADLAVMCKNPGTFFMETESSPKRNHLLGKVNQFRVPSQKVVLLRVIGDKRLEMVVPSALPRLPEYMQSSIAEKSSEIPPANKYNYEFSMWKDDKNGMVMGVNKQKFEHRFVNYSMRVGEPQQWELSVENYANHHCDESLVEKLEHRDNISLLTKNYLIHEQVAGHNDKMEDVKHTCHTMNHPFHMHASHFQITSRDAAADPDNILFGVGEWRDTVPLFKTQVQIRFTPQDHMIGRIMTHCHVAFHADNGMTQLVQVLPAEETM
ncbi:Multicopper oxidase mco, partial [Globisporangium splendens]